jgi:hypothetical protein
MELLTRVQTWGPRLWARTATTLILCHVRGVVVAAASRRRRQPSPPASAFLAFGGRRRRRGCCCAEFRRHHRRRRWRRGGCTEIPRPSAAAAGRRCRCLSRQGPCRFLRRPPPGRRRRAALEARCQPSQPSPPTGPTPPLSAPPAAGSAAAGGGGGPPSAESAPAPAPTGSTSPLSAPPAVGSSAAVAGGGGGAPSAAAAGPSTAGFVAVKSNVGCASKSHCFVASRSSARICLSRRPEKARVTADICDHSEELAEMWQVTVHGPQQQTGVQS